MEIFAISDLMCRLDSQIKIFEANKKDGIMSRNKIFYDENLTQDEINEIFKETRIKLGEKHGFNGLKMTLFVITQIIIQYIKIFLQ